MNPYESPLAYDEKPVREPTWPKVLLLAVISGIEIAEAIILFSSSAAPLAVRIGGVVVGVVGGCFAMVATAGALMILFRHEAPE